ncbi:MAG: sugar ABC transporter substrate-binding protein [Nocardioidaceae bacterium]
MFTFARRAIPAFMLALVATALAACGSSDEVADASGQACKETKTIGFSHPVGEAEAVKIVKKFVQKRAVEVGCVKVLLDNTTGSNLESQRAAVEGWVQQGIDAIVLWPVDNTAFTGLQKEAQDKGIKWLTYSSHMDGQDGSVGFDNVLSGKLIADDVAAWVRKHYPNGGVSAAVTQLAALPDLKGRWEEPIKKLKELNIPVVSQQDCADQTCGLQIGEDVLREHKDLRIFIGLNDDAALGAMKAFEAAKVDPDDVYIAGQDGGSQSLQAIAAGKFYKATAAIRLDQLGYSIIDNSLASINGTGDTDKIAPTVLASLADKKTLTELQGMFQ